MAEKELEGIQALQTVRLSETGIAKEGEAVVYKYQASDSLLREVMSWYQPQEIPTLMTVTGRRSRMIGVYSPIGRCGRAALPLPWVRYWPGRKGALHYPGGVFWSFSLTGTVYTGGLSDLLYYYIQREYSPVRLGSVTYNWGGLDYIPPVTYAEDKTGIHQEVFAGLIQKIASDGAYEELILDVGMFCGGTEELLGICDVVYVPVKDDAVSTAKAGGMERLSEAVWAERDMGKTEIFASPGTSSFPDPGKLSGAAFVE